MTHTKITTRNYRTYLLNQAVKTGDHALANLAKTATAVTLKNLYLTGYKMTAQQAATTREEYFSMFEDDRRN